MDGQDTPDPGVPCPAAAGCAGSNPARSRDTALALALTLGATGGVLALAWMWSRHRGLEPGYLTQDPAAFLDAAWYVGALTTVGLFLWTASATSALLAGTVVRGRAPASAVLLAGGGLSVLLALDDAFLFHERIAPDVVGVPQRGVYLGYVCLAAAYLACFGRTLERMEWPLLAAAAVLFGASIVVDGYEAIDESLIDDANVFFVEDGLKLLGISAWALFHLRSAYSALSADASRSDRHEPRALLPPPGSR